MKPASKHLQGEQILISKYQDNKDMESLGVLYARYMELVFGLCMKYLKNTADSQDAVMGIYELIAKKLKTHKVDNFKSWLYTVSKNYCLEKLRKANRDLTKEKEISRVQSAKYFHPDEVNENEVIYDRLKQCLEKLPTLQKKVIELFYYQKKSYIEIVDQEQLEWKNVRTNIQNGRRNLKKCIEAYES